MSRKSLLNARAIGIFTLLTVAGLAVAQESTDSSQKCSKHRYTLASLAGNYSVTGVFGPHVGGYVGTVDIDAKGIITNDIGVAVDPALPGILDVVSTGESSINPDGTGLFTLNVTVIGGGGTATYHMNFVIEEARLRGDELIATKISMLQQEPSPLPNGPIFASFVYTRRPE